MPPLASPRSTAEKGQLVPVCVGQGSGLPATRTYLSRKIIHGKESVAPKINRKYRRGFPEMMPELCAQKQ